MTKFTKFILRKIKILAFIAAISLIFYFLFRSIFLFSSKYSFWDMFFGAVLLLGETYILIHALGFIMSVFKVKENTKIEDIIINKIDHFPPVAVIVAARHEPAEILRETFTTLVNLDYPNKKVYLLDDSSDEKFIKEADKIGEDFGIFVFRRAKRHGAKAGIINDFIGNIGAKYIAIFDADQNPMPDFLKKTISHLEKDENLAFIQTPQFYTNMDDSPVCRAATIQQAIFYEIICDGKSIDNAMFCCGTNVVFRKSALDKVGGFDEENITEDFATSVKLHANGYKSLYLNSVSAFGMAPESLPEYFKQQSRWASGTISVLRRLIIQFFSNPFSLTPLQWWEYFLAGTFYFVGWAFFILMITPIVFLIFNIPSYFMNPLFYFGTFIPYYILSMAIFYSTMIRRNYRFKTIFLGTIMGMLSFPVLMKSAVLGLFNKRMKFAVTAKRKVTRMPFINLWPYHLMLALNLTAIIFGGIRIYNGEDILPISVNGFWAMYHTFVISNIYFLNRNPVINEVS